MKTKTKQATESEDRVSIKLKRNYYFHADEDFREDREWGKINSEQTQTDHTNSGRSLSA